MDWHSAVRGSVGSNALRIALGPCNFCRSIVKLAGVICGRKTKLSVGHFERFDNFGKGCERNRFAPEGIDIEPDAPGLCLDVLQLVGRHEDHCYVVASLQGTGNVYAIYAAIELPVTQQNIRLMPEGLIHRFYCRPGNCNVVAAKLEVVLHGFAGDRLVFNHQHSHQAATIHRNAVCLSIIQSQFPQ
jgi:hypothetical protein